MNQTELFQNLLAGKCLCRDDRSDEYYLKMHDNVVTWFRKSDNTSLRSPDIINIKNDRWKLYTPKVFFDDLKVGQIFLSKNSIWTKIGDKTAISEDMVIYENLDWPIEMLLLSRMDYKYLFIGYKYILSHGGKVHTYGDIDAAKSDYVWLVSY